MVPTSLAKSCVGSRQTSELPPTCSPSTHGSSNLSQLAQVPHSPVHHGSRKLERAHSSSHQTAKDGVDHAGRRREEGDVVGRHRVHLQRRRWASVMAGADTLLTWCSSSRGALTSSFGTKQIVQAGPAMLVSPACRSGENMVMPGRNPPCGTPSLRSASATCRWEREHQRVRQALHRARTSQVDCRFRRAARSMSLILVLSAGADTATPCQRRRAGTRRQLLEFMKLASEI